MQCCLLRSLWPSLRNCFSANTALLAVLQLPFSRLCWTGKCGLSLLCLLPHGLVLLSSWAQLEVADLCPAVGVSCISCCGTLGYNTGCCLQAAPGEPPLDFRNAYHGLQSGLVVCQGNVKTWKYARGSSAFWSLYKNAGCLQRGGVISFLLPRSMILRGNSLLSLTLSVHEPYAASMLKASVSVLRMYDHIV